MGHLLTLFFTADTHFGHAGALGLFRRPFPTVAAMDAAMLDRWNAAVAPHDTVWHLGDVALGRTPDQVAALLSRLNGTKHLVPGNNDPPAIRALPHWASVADYTELPEHGLVLCHYALRHWRNQSRGWTNPHGHSHGRLPSITRQRDVGVDCWDFAPVPLDALRRPRRE